MLHDVCWVKYTRWLSLPAEVIYSTGFAVTMRYNTGTIGNYIAGQLLHHSSCRLRIETTFRQQQV
jgi:hypothetical protein